MRIALIVFLVLMTSCKQAGTDWIDRSKHQGLYDINYSDAFETYCTEAHPKHIKNTIGNLEQAKVYFDKTFNEDLNFAVLFMDDTNWDTYAFTPPPGMPQALHQGNMILGLGNSVMALRAKEGLKQVPDPKLKILKEHFGEELDLDLFFRDALSLHELGHLYQFYKTGKGTQRHWLNEIFGNLCQVAAAKNLNTKDVFHRMDVYQLFLINSNRWGKLKFKTLKQFEDDYFEVLKQGRNYGWYQSQFYLKAKELYSKFGDEFLNDFRDFLIDINPENAGKMNDKELETLMIKTFENQVLDILTWEHDS
ncbi:MAG: hypothetical protein AAFX55_18395 [Bacteroidota bacterium]